MNQETLTPVEGAPEQIGFYLAGMEEVRGQLRDAVAELSDEVAHAKLRDDTHSIVQLILHCGEAEFWWIQCVVNGRDPSDAPSYWDVLKEGNESSKGFSAQTAVAEIDLLSTKTRQLLSGFSDEDLDKYYERKGSDGNVYSRSLRWILHHLIDHEAQHKGQILMLKRLLGSEG